MTTNQLVYVQVNFPRYAAKNFLNVSKDDRGWYITNAVSWTVEQIRKDGWLVELTGETELQADDTIRTYFKVEI